MKSTPLTYVDHDGVRRELKECRMTVDEFDRPVLRGGDAMRIIIKRVSCECADPCGCVPDLLLLVNGQQGNGDARWVIDPKTNEEGYACSFFGWNFFVKGHNAAAHALRQRLEMVGSSATVVVL